jgi:oligopeptide/dipeptide ABC transporter ATP-binding protein
MKPAEPLLSVQDLKTYFNTPAGVLKAVDGVSFEVRKGETFGVIGESGCGKTALCLSVMRLISCPPGKHEGGEILFEGRNVSAMKEKELRSFRGGEVSMIFQEPMTALNPVFTAGHQIAEGILLHRGMNKAAAYAQTLELLDRAGLRCPERVARSYPFTLSGGMRQRVMIAMALASRPKLLIADEPATSLDMVTQAQILSLIVKAKKETGLSCLYITHDLGILGGIADRIMVMYSGRPCESAPAGELLAGPLHPYTRGLIEAGGHSLPAGFANPAKGKTLPGRLPVIPGHVPSLRDKPSGCPFHPRCPLAGERCSGQFPPRYEAAGDHEVWCWQYAGNGNGLLFSVSTNTAVSENKNEIVDFNNENNAHNRNDNKDNAVIFEMKNIKKYFSSQDNFWGKHGGEVKAVDGVSLSIPGGSTTAVVGESGCGKTTLGRIAVKLLEPSSGELFFDGSDVTRVRGKDKRCFRRRTQMVFQDPVASLNPRMTAYDIIGEGLKNYGLVKNSRQLRERVVFVAEKCGLVADQCALYPHQFSGGQRQRVAIARALAAEPEFVVCDEAVSSLDVSVRAQIVNLLKDLQDEMGLTYLFMTHDLRTAEFMSRESAVMYQGRIVETGPSPALFHRPLHPYARALLNAGPAALSAPVSVPAGQASSYASRQRTPAGNTVPPGCNYASRCPQAEERCREETPECREAEPGRFAACFCIQGVVPRNRSNT